MKGTWGKQLILAYFENIGGHVSWAYTYLIMVLDNAKTAAVKDKTVKKVMGTSEK